jgi:histidinol-phosphate/aromatic aminotransferase/cobyric acid decarboxylase-like protein
VVLRPHAQRQVQRRARGGSGPGLAGFFRAGVEQLGQRSGPYGPPPAVMAALRNMPEAAVRTHPYTAASDVESAYARHLGRPASEFAAGRGASDLIWSLAQHFGGKTAGVPMPGYTEFRQAFPRARPFGGGPATHPADVLDEAMRACDVVIVSNPHNPTGQVIQRSDLAGIALGHPGSVLIVDESYIDFLPDDAAVTLVGCQAPNVIVLRSPSKFYGLAGVRSGAAWSLRPLGAQWRRTRANWPVSAFAAEALKAALAAKPWAATTRRILASDAAWLDGCLARSALDIVPGRLHFRLLTGAQRHIERFAAALGASGIAVRVLEEAYGAGSPAVRISAPRREERQTLAAALNDPPQGQ